NGYNTPGAVVAPNYHNSGYFPVASNYTGGLIAVPSGTVMLSSLGGPSAVRFTPATTGTISISVTFTNPMFDPYNGPGGRHGDDPWSWTDGQPDYGVFETTGM